MCLVFINFQRTKYWKSEEYHRFLINNCTYTGKIRLCQDNQDFKNFNHIAEFCGTENQQVLSNSEMIEG